MTGLLSICAIIALCGIQLCAGGSLDRGAEMVDRAGHLICWYEYEKQPNPKQIYSSNCEMNTKMSEYIRQFVEQGADEQGQIDALKQFYGGTLKSWLPVSTGYSDCDAFIANPKKPPATDMSTVLKDGDGPYLYKGLAHCMVGKVKERYGAGAISDMALHLQCDKEFTDACTGGSLDQGVKMNDRAMHLACWYEYAYRLPDHPDTSTVEFGNCQMNFQMSQLRDQWPQMDKYTQIKSLSSFVPERISQWLPPVGGYTDCKTFLEDSSKPPTVDMGLILKDGKGPYPFKGFAHCIVGKVVDKYGQTAVPAMVERRSYDPNFPPINKILVGRDNEYRAMHGAAPLELDPLLIRRAQSWADKLANECQPLTHASHITYDNPEDMYQGQHMGENIFATGVMDEADIAITSSNSWYSEVKYYPWPAYVPGETSTSGEIGHFTAQVWKGSTLSGYGIGKRDGCDTVYVVARYWPGGNVQGPYTYKQNVGPYQGN